MYTMTGRSRKPVALSCWNSVLGFAPLLRHLLETEAIFFSALEPTECIKLGFLHLILEQ